jgi:hypothetical protein
VTEPSGLRKAVIATSTLTPEAFLRYGRVLVASHLDRRFGVECVLDAAVSDEL